MITGLEEYQQKRNFEHTFEPQGSDVYTSASLDNLSFVVQHHLARRDHYDFRLEWKGVLLSWAVPKGPSYNPSDKRLAIQVEDHPYEYKNFEGLIPKGEYGGGTVMLWDEGYWKPQYDVNDGLEKGVLKFELFGKRLKGNWALIRLEQKEGETKQNWLLLKEKDEYTLKEDGIASYDTSIRTGRTMQEIEKGTDEKFIKNPISHIDVQLAKLVDQVPKSGDWLYEIKYDGYRIVAFVEGNNALLITRNGKDFSKHFADIALSLSSWANGRAMILDGEMVVTDRQGKTDFQALQNYMKSPKDNNLTYIVFDLLALDGKDLREQPLTERKQILQDLMKDAPDNIHYSQHVEGSGKQSFEAACELGMEGIIGKKANSKYSGTRKGDWIKIKCANRQELVIGGYTRSDKRHKLCFVGLL